MLSVQSLRDPLNRLGPLTHPLTPRLHAGSFPFTKAVIIDVAATLSIFADWLIGKACQATKHEETHCTPARENSRTAHRHHRRSHGHDDPHLWHEGSRHPGGPL